jgi:hypothetical protein
MFKKIVSQLSLSPATIEQVARYAKTTRQNQRLYGWAFIILAAVTILYGAALLTQPVHTSSPTSNDLVPGGLPSADSILSAYDANTNGFQDATRILGINRQILAKAVSQESCSPTDMRYITGRTLYSQAADTQEYQFKNTPPLFIQPASIHSDISGWCGISTEGIAFTILTSDGNIATAALPATPVQQPSPLTRAITVDSDTLSATNDITFTLTVKNDSTSAITEDVWITTGDIDEYAHISYASAGGIISVASHQILWPQLTIPANGAQTMTFTAHLNQPVDETAQQRHNTYAYDCTVQATFGTTATAHISCPLSKDIEQILFSLPPLYPPIGITIFILLTLFCGFNYFALRLQSKELRIIRTQINTGGL